MAQVTISEALSCMKTLRERHAELVNLRNENSRNHTRRYGIGGDKDETVTPVYDVKKLDAIVNQVAREIRKLDVAIKNANAKLKVPGYDWSEDVLGEIA